MDLGPLVQEHLYTALVLGSLVEGETTVTLAGYAAHQGYATLGKVIVVAAVVNFVLDLAWYGLGRWRGQALTARWPVLRRAVEKMSPRLHRNRRTAIFLVRFMYGLRTAGPIALGIVGVPWREVVVFNALGAAAWAAVIASLGYAFGHAVTVFLHELAHYELEAAIALAALVTAVLLLRRWRARHRPPEGGGNVTPPSPRT